MSARTMHERRDIASLGLALSGILLALSAAPAFADALYEGQVITDLGAAISANHGGCRVSVGDLQFDYARVRLGPKVPRGYLAVDATSGKSWGTAGPGSVLLLKHNGRRQILMEGFSIRLLYTTTHGRYDLITKDLRWAWDGARYQSAGWISPFRARFFPKRVC